MDHETVLLFTANGMGQAEGELQLKLAKIFLGMLASGEKPAGKICFYTEGVKLACEGSPVLDELAALQRPAWNWCFVKPVWIISGSLRRLRLVLSVACRISSRR